MLEKNNKCDLNKNDNNIVGPYKYGLIGLVI